MEQSKGAKEMNVEEVISLLKDRLNLKYDKELSNHFDINQYDVGNWRKRNKIPNKYIGMINDIIGKDVITDNKGEDIVDTAYAHLNELNEFKNEKIQRLEEEVRNLKRDNKILEQASKPLNVIYDTVIGDFQSRVLIKNILSLDKLERNISEISNYHVLAKRLGTTEKTLAKYLCVGEYYKMNEHPVDKIIVPSSLKELKNVTSTIPVLHNQFKFTFGAIYYKFTIIYNIKNKFAITTCYIKINWGREVVVETKNVIHEPKSA